MRIVPFAISAVVTAGLVFVFNRPIGPLPMPLGKFISPQHGFWQNAEPKNQSFDADLEFANLKGKAEVYFDERLVPHVFAENDEDLYFIQGYLHAKFRLFQMDLQTKAAEGRASEIAGKKAIDFDQRQRRLGMRFAAENAVKEIEKDPQSKAMFDAYTNGVNAYISSLTEAKIPVEYKLMNFKPEKWSNIRTALLLKMMAKMLSGETESDLPNTNAKAFFTEEDMKLIYPQVPDSLMPIVPRGTVFDPPGIVPVQPATADSLYFQNRSVVATRPVSESERSNGSNNWVVAGSKTQSKAPILCNDPHLELSLPSIWYEMQLQTPTSNAYGVSLPGSPFVIIGFNDSIAWGVTNAQRDVKDYYEIKFRDRSKNEYWFNGQWTKTDLRPETIKVKGGKTLHDTVAYTIFGPVMYDESFPDDSASKKNLAVRWVAHDPSNEGMTFYKLNRAKNYDDYENAIRSFECPGQNFVFASKSGDIAIWQQGKFPARWNRQGLYVMPGEDSSYMWQGFIPQMENPHSKNPEQGFLQSANQRPVDSTYPYFIPGSYITARGITINNKLSSMTGITPDDMMKLQNNYFNTTAEDVVPILLKNIEEDKLNAKEKEYLDIVKNWDMMASPDSKGQTLYNSWWLVVRINLFMEDILKAKDRFKEPDEQTVMELLKKDSTLEFVNSRIKDLKKKLSRVVTYTFKGFVAVTDSLMKKDPEKFSLEWYKKNKAGIYHITDKSAKKVLLPFARTKLHVGGSGDIVNAIKGSHGPSWRMVVQLTNETEAYGVYPGGQSGNPGSKYYDNMVDNWVEGKYYKLWFMHDADRASKDIKWTMKFNKK
ncbi:MAG: penicillin acylase family protein [Chitinophagaceae bacterium]|nr:penicillin acylase family protein [Chitinophagaceae bacterium]